jgi:uncharacterized protein DUF6088
MSIHKLIAIKIDQHPKGSLLFPADFRGLGSYNAIKMSLSRHAETGRLERLGNGIYFKNKITGKTPRPTLEAIAIAIAKKERIKIKAAGAFVLHKLGISSTPPTDLVYITDGEPRNILIGEKRLIFKSTTPKKLRLSNGISGLLIQALEEIGKQGINDSLESKIIEYLSKEKKEVLFADLKLAPAWIYDLLYRLNQQIIR